VKASKTSGGRRTPVRHTIALGIVIFLVYSLMTIIFVCIYSNMTRPMPLWYVKESAKFEALSKDHERIEVVRVPGG